jgi:imidazolonepropionase-like amidohydrolase
MRRGPDSPVAGGIHVRSTQEESMFRSLRRTAVALMAVLSSTVVAAGADTPPARTLVHAGTLIDGSGGPPRRQVTIVVEGERIAAVEDGFRAPAAGEQLVDMKQGWVLPGFIDLHVHLGTESAPGAYIERFTLNPADIVLRAAAHARTTLHAGFTTVRNLGDGYNTTIALRDAIRKGWVEGPRVYSAGKSLATTGGHADPTNAWSDLIEGDPAAKEGVVNGAAEAAKAVRQRYKDGADLIKITATGGVLSLARSPDAPQFSDDELAAVVRTARDYGLAVAAHAHGAEGMKRAIRAGVTSIEHGTFMDEETIGLMKKHGTWYVPTLSAGIFVGEKAKVEGFFPDIVRPKAARVGVQIRDTFARAHRAGVKIAFGTDAGVGPHGDNAREFAYMVEGGMTAAEAIHAATGRAAQVLGAENDLGTIAPGRYADLVGVAADPLADVGVLSKPSLVVKGGRVVLSR